MKPEGTFRLIEGAEYEVARAAAKSANRMFRREHELVGRGVEVHEIKPIKFSRSPIGPDKKIPLPRNIHRRDVTPWRNGLQRHVEKYFSG